MTHLVLKNGRVIDPATRFDNIADVYISDGRIAAIGAAPANWDATDTIDISGKVVCPGLIDLAARLREPGFEYKATLASELAAAVAGGVTSLACPPDTDPALDEPGLIQMLKHRAASLQLAKVYPLGAVTVGLKGSLLTEMAELRDSGVLAFSQAETPFADNLVLMRAMQYAATFDLPLRLRPQDHALANSGVAHEGEVSTRLGLAGIPVLAETIAISNIVMLMKETGARVHLCRLSSREGIDMVRAAKRHGLPLTCDVSINHVHLADIDIGYFNTNCHLSPPLRSVADRDAISTGLAEGTIDAICSDHTPVDDDGKLLPFGESEIGATGLELLLPLTLMWAEHKHLPLTMALGKITHQPAQQLGLPAGTLEIGAAADICVFDPQASWTVKPESLKSQGKNTPFSGMELRGKVHLTLIDGKVVYQATAN